MRTDTSGKSAEDEINDQSSAAAQPSSATAPAAPKLVTQNPAAKTPGNPAPVPAELVARMRRRRAAITQADIARIIRAAKQAGAAEVEVRLSDSGRILIRLQPDNSIASDGAEIIL